MIRQIEQEENNGDIDEDDDEDDSSSSSFTGSEESSSSIHSSILGDQNNKGKERKEKRKKYDRESSIKSMLVDPLADDEERMYDVSQDESDTSSSIEGQSLMSDQLSKKSQKKLKK